MTTIGKSTTAWAITTGAAGMQAQARGLARAVADVVEEKTVGLRPPWSWLPAQFALFALNGLDPHKDRLAPPWPDLVVTCGRKSAIVGAAIRRASRGRTLAVHVQDPLADPGAFDLVVVLPRDRVRGANVLVVPTALHDVALKDLDAAAKAWRKRLARLGRPLIGVVVGGSSRGRPFTVEDADRLIEAVQRARGSGAGVALTPSRRTPGEARARFAEAFNADPRAFVWDLEDENPYRGILGLADRLVVTSDSLSMISEALSTGRPVEIFDLGLTGGRHAGFIADLMASGQVRRFEGDPEPPPVRPAVDSTRLAALAVRRLLDARR